VTYRDFDHYAAVHGPAPALHAHLRAQAGMSGAAIRRADRQYLADVDAYYDARARLRTTWDRGVADGTILVANRRARLEALASGHNDNPSVQAARRILARA
jgi:hypothetical protein